MVDITTLEDQQRVAQIMGKKPEEARDPLEWMRPTLRLDIPMTDCNSIAKAAEILEDLARRLYRITVNHQANPDSRRLEAWSEGRAAQERLKQYTITGRRGK